MSAKLCLNLCLFRWQKSTLSLLGNLISKGSYILKTLFSVGLIKLSNFFRKPTYESVLLISGSSLFHSFILYGKKEFLKISVLHNSGLKKPWFFEIFVMEVTYRDRKVALMIWPYINSKVFSSIVYLSKIQNLTLGTMFLWMSLW